MAPQHPRRTRGTHPHHHHRHTDRGHAVGHSHHHRPNRSHNQNQEPRPRNANTGAGVTRRGHHGSGQRGARGHGAGVSAGVRLVDRMTWGDVRGDLGREGMVGGGVRLAGRVSGGHGDGEESRVTRESSDANYGCGGRERGGGADAVRDRSVVGLGQKNGSGDFTKEDDNNDENWDLDLEINTPTPTPTPNQTSTSTSTSHTSLFYPQSSHPQSSQNTPIQLTPPIHLLNQLLSQHHQQQPPAYQFVSPHSVLPKINNNNGNTYRGPDTIRRLVSNRKLQAILKGKKIPGERKGSSGRGEEMRLRM
ncbi:hypothetical protein T440DRAFT_506093 [Plenodomus tracheiphilus IPT5]|uniref:Uncharacterized protein n=1 Tax=Plenodomus tracheiphilus IPT5 TaxID=1408161 RepID=A0A6A7BD33_9PLEO|nr:hypothetical protein T440DRAFT_506093 [Plenodomus tracheiphilus IPT5]